MLLLVIIHQLLVLFTSTESRREGKGNTYSREGPEVEMTEAIVWDGRQPGKAGGKPH